MGKPLAAEELGQLRGLLTENLEQGFRAGLGAKLVVGYETTVTPLLRKNLACTSLSPGSAAPIELVLLSVSAPPNRDDIVFTT